MYTSNGTASGFARNQWSADRRPNDVSPDHHLSTSVSDPTHQISSDTKSSTPPTTIILRRLPRNTGIDALRSMLLFAKDLNRVEFVSPTRTEDNGYATAIATFRTAAGAVEAQERLNGKPNASNEANMIVEVADGEHANSFASRRNTIDGDTSRQQISPASSNGSSNNSASHRQSSRFGETFAATASQAVQSPKGSMPLHISPDFPNPESSTHYHNLFSPQSPVGNGFGDNFRNAGRSVINDDTLDDDTGALLRDPLAYARNGHQQGTRRTTTNGSQAQMPPTNAFGSLSLNTAAANGSNGNSHNNSSLTSPRPMQPRRQSSSAAGTPAGLHGMQTNGNFTAPYARYNHPPANPADQNPPCNTLYVGNLPLDTSEDELKQLFSKQRGYKRLCFRVKQNGPMCFVEFEDTSFATKALNELYGHMLHNSVKGGIRLSFSKNPLGVRTGQMNGMGPTSPLGPQAMAFGGNGLYPPPGFSSPSGPPPGLGATLPPPSLRGPSQHGAQMSPLPSHQPFSKLQDGMYGSDMYSPGNQHSGQHFRAGGGGHQSQSGYQSAYQNGYHGGYANLGANGYFGGPNGGIHNDYQNAR